LDLLIAAIGLLVAVWAVLPRERRLDLELRFGLFDAALIATSVVAIGYLDLYSFFKAHHWTRGLPTWTVGLVPAQVEHLVLILLLLIVGLRGRFAWLSARKISRFRALTDELLWSESYYELLVLFQTHIKRFFKIYHGDFWSRRLRARWLPDFSLASLVRALDNQERVPQPPQLVGGIIRPVIARLPDYNVEISIAAHTARNVLLSRGFVGVLARSRPYLGIEIMESLMTPGDGFFREEFVELYFDALLAHKTGIFYSELANNCNRAGLRRYRIPNENRLLYFLFANDQIAHELQVWRPVGEFMLRELDQLSREPEADPYNHAYMEEEKWQSESPLFAGVQFFEIMVSEALFQGIKWHMWLYYTTYLVKKIVRNYAPTDDPLVRANVSEPIWYSHLLYVIFSALRDWILAVQEVPEDQANVLLESTRADHDNGNIPKSAILALGDCLHSIVCSDKLEKELRDMLIDVVLNVYFELRAARRLDRYAETLIDSIRRGGPRLRTIWTGIYRDRINAAIQRQDRVSHGSYLSDLEAALP